ncbi:DUF4240 domain-containing protein [Kitasatospora sp. NPDC057541]|uniref:DUF4240 domain-containing protein n=1 Tax=Kitasatospora sp. NPDC057541 TaxID=3346161 RepID=UPI00368A31A7
MGFEGQVWQLVRGHELVGEIVVEETDFPWLRGRFIASPAFAMFEPLFARSRALADAEDRGGFDGAYDEVRKALSLRSPSGPVAEFLLHVQGGHAWFRWSDESFGDEEEDGDHAVYQSRAPLNSGVDPGLSVMTWERFWQLVEVLGGEAVLETCQGFEDACGRLTEVLSREPVSQIIGFGERLAEALHRLDQADFGTLPVLGMEPADGSRFPQSADGFLYSRAAVVAAGRQAYESVLGNTERFVPFTALRCEGLLYVHEEAFEQVTGTEWDRLTRYVYESCSNTDGWPDLHK